MKDAFEQLTEPGERPPPFLRTTCLVKQNAKLENGSADEPTQVEGRTDATWGVLHLWRPSNFAANLASLHLWVPSQCPIFHRMDADVVYGGPPFTWSRFTCGGLSPSCPMSGYPRAMSAMSAGPGPTCRASLAPRREPYIYQMHRYCRPRIFEFRCQTRPKFYFKARRARKMMEKSA